MAAEIPRLHLERVTRRFGALVVTNNLSLQVAAGEIYGVIGPNGAGKSSLIRMINGQLRADAGRIQLDGKDVSTLAPAARCRAGIATAFQIPQPFGGMSVYENLLVAAAHGGGRREVYCRAHCAELLHRTGLLARANHAAATLNLVDRKRLELARALASGPKLLLLDEIAGGLTDEEIPALLDIICPLRGEGVTVFWIEHVVHALFAAIDRLLVIDFGTHVAEGDPRTVFARFRARFSQRSVQPHDLSLVAQSLSKNNLLRRCSGSSRRVPPPGFRIVGLAFNQDCPDHPRMRIGDCHQGFVIAQPHSQLHHPTL